MLLLLPIIIVLRLASLRQLLLLLLLLLRLIVIVLLQLLLIVSIMFGGRLQTHRLLIKRRHRRRLVSVQAVRLLIDSYRWQRFVLGHGLGLRHLRCGGRGRVLQIELTELLVYLGELLIDVGQ